MIELPIKFKENMKQLLKEEYESYLNSFENERIYGLRVNTSKISVENFIKICPFKIEPIPFIKDGFYYDEKDKPSKHPYYYAGLYYLQEPSAMLPGEVLPIEENDIVLDACSAPGGKALKLANKLHGTGLLFSNDISVSRQQITLKNLETFGIKNSFIISEDINKLTSYFPNYFDKILIDAPCSGEGMFRKDSSLIKSWLEKGNEYYSNIQKQIIDNGIKLLKDGGMLVYSTCTFNKTEDEDIVEYALSKYPDLKVLPIEKYEGFENGLTKNTYNAVRLYPHRIKGEGHFVCLMQKGNSSHNKQMINKQVKCNEPFINNTNMIFNNGSFITRNNKLYFEPDTNVNTKGLRITRSGLYLGEYKHDKFEPSQAFAMAVTKNEFNNIINLKLEDERVLKYLKCETLDVKDFYIDGYALVCVNNYPLGFGLIKNGILKNKYPANYRYQ